MFIVRVMYETDGVCSEGYLVHNGTLGNFQEADVFDLDQVGFFLPILGQNYTIHKIEIEEV